ncbi:c-type cytochrome [Coralloluteibacterium stylophorae]|uniref:Cytochrome c n=1 Tax=Coralloluteibacterium stylophorae TaxID=1776034 RepID=A0A8J7VS11_9GAMM|nr:cytochrome c [Coralloluteibacterium stylophorae]MBS7457873.1 cytochrome c [Coralloluteibacterium stylophorae]
MPRPLLLLVPLALAACARAPSPPAPAAADATTAATTAPAQPRPLGMCTACHGRDGIGRMAGTPNLAGQDEPYLRRALRAYRDNERNGGPMNAIAGSLSEPDIAELAAWYAAQPAGGPLPAAPEAAP